MGSFLLLWSVMSKPIKEWREDDMPREKFLFKGASALSDAELLAILMRSGTREENAVEMSRHILDLFGNNFGEMKKASFEDFIGIKGLGKCKAVTLLALFELATRISLSEVPKMKQIYSSCHAAKIISPLIKDLTHEECWVLYLNRGNKLICKERLSIGGLSATVVDVKLIIKSSMAKLASSIILVHNHPSGNNVPSTEDKVQTKKLQEAALLCDIVLLDHLIIAGNNYYSFNDEGLM